MVLVRDLMSVNAILFTLTILILFAAISVEPASCIHASKSEAPQKRKHSKRAPIVLKAGKPQMEPARKPLQGSVDLYSTGIGGAVLSTEAKKSITFSQAPYRGVPIKVTHDGSWVVNKFVPAFNTWVQSRAPEPSKLYHRYPVAIGKRYVAIIDSGFANIGGNTIRDRSGYYDPNWRWHPVGSEGIRRINAALPDGGWLCDLITGRWVRLPKHASFNPQYSFIGDRIVGWGGPSCHLVGVIYDPTTNNWTRLPRAPIEPRYCTIYAVSDSKFLVAGGHEGTPLQDGAIFDTKTWRWTKLPPAPVPFAYGHTGCVWRDKFVLMSGRTTQVAAYDLTTHSWSMLPNRPIAALKVGSGWTNLSCEVAGDTMLIWAGPTRKASPESIESWSYPAEFSAAAFDFLRNRWYDVPKPPLYPRWHSESCAGANGVYIYSGWDQAECEARPLISETGEPITPDISLTTAHALKDGACFSFSKNRWIPIAPIPGTVPKFARWPGWQ